MLGRVFGAFEALALLAMGIGALLAPVLVSSLGSRGAVLVAGLIMPVTLLPFWRRLASIDEAAPVPTELVELLRGIPIFAPLPAPQLERLAQSLVDVRIEPGSAVFEEGDPGDRFYVIAEGRAASRSAGSLSERWSPATSSARSPCSTTPRTATVRAITDLRLHALDPDTFVATVTGHAASAEAAGSIAARLPSLVAN